MSTWDWIRVANIVVILALLITNAHRYATGPKQVNPQNPLGDQSHLPMLRMGAILLFLGLMEGFVESVAKHLPGGPRVFVLLPGLLLILGSAYWNRITRVWLRTKRRLQRQD